MGLDMLQLVVVLVPVQGRDSALYPIYDRADERLWSVGVHCYDGAFSHLGVFPQCLSYHYVGDGYNSNTKGEVNYIQVKDNFPFSPIQAVHRQTDLGFSGPKSSQGGQSKTCSPQKNSEQQGTREGSSPVGLLTKNHPQSVKCNDSHGFEGHNYKSRAC